MSQRVFITRVSVRVWERGYTCFFEQMYSNSVEPACHGTGELKRCNVIIGLKAGIYAVTQAVPVFHKPVQNWHRCLSWRKLNMFQIYKRSSTFVCVGDKWFEWKCVEGRRPPLLQLHTVSCRCQHYPGRVTEGSGQMLRHIHRHNQDID